MALKSWAVVYERAIRDDGTLFFPERLGLEFLAKARRRMGSYIFANQYQNEIVPDDAKNFKKEWLKYYDDIPKKVNTFAFIDPAISQEEGSDNTGIVIVDVDLQGQWYLKVAKRAKLTPTNIIDLCFEIDAHFKPKVIGIEDVAFQKSLLYMVSEEMKVRNTVIPVSGVKVDTETTKEARILGLVPRFEWGRLLINRGLHDFEMEYAQFPRGKRDIMDALAYIERIAFAPEKERENPNERPHPTSSRYESLHIRDLVKRANENI